jgi:hypothetical protein
MMRFEYQINHLASQLSRGFEIQRQSRCPNKTLDITRRGMNSATGASRSTLEKPSDANDIPNCKRLPYDYVPKVLELLYLSLRRRLSVPSSSGSPRAFRPVNPCERIECGGDELCTLHPQTSRRTRVCALEYRSAMIISHQ